MRASAKILFVCDLICAALVVAGVCGLYFFHFDEQSRTVASVAAVCVGAAGWIVTYRARKPLRDRRLMGTRASQAIRENLYSGELHEYRIVQPDQFPHLDHFFYEEAQRTIEAKGFRLLGDVENVTITRALPRTQTFTRMLTSSDGTIMAGIRQMKWNVPQSAAQHTIELHTEFSDGTYLITNNTGKGATSQATDELTGIYLGGATPFEELLRVHQDGFDVRLASTPGLAATRIDSIDQAIHLERRLHGATARQEQARGFVKPTPAQRAARKILSDRKAIYSSTHEYRDVSAEQFPQLDLDFYDGFRRAFERLGFQFVADIENLTVSRRFPHMRSFLRVMLSGDGQIVASALHFKPRSGDVKTMDLETELSDGTFLSTTTERIRSLPFPGIDKQAVAATSSADELLAAHQQRIAEALAAGAGRTVRIIHDRTEMTQSQDRMQMIRVRYMQARGMFSAADMMKLRGRDLTPREQAVVDEIARLAKQESRQIQP